MKRSTMLIGVSAVAATMAATLQFAGGLGGDDPAAGDAAVVSTAPPSSSTATSSTVRTIEPPATVAPTSTVSVTLVNTLPEAAAEPIADSTTSTLLVDESLQEVLAMLSGLTVADPDPSRQPYDRDTYQPDGWADLDGDCINGRHETLITQSATPVQMTSSGCSVEFGSWTDPYTGMAVTEANDITIDHV